MVAHDYNSDDSNKLRRARDGEKNAGALPKKLSCVFEPENQDEHDKTSFSVGDLLTVNPAALKKGWKKRFGDDEIPDFDDTSKKFVCRVKCMCKDKKNKDVIGVAWVDPNRDPFYKWLIDRGDLEGNIHPGRGVDYGVDFKTKANASKQFEWRQFWQENLHLTGGDLRGGRIRGDTIGLFTKKGPTAKIKTRTWLLQKEQEYAAEMQEKKRACKELQIGDHCSFMKSDHDGDDFPAKLWRPRQGVIRDISWFSRPGKSGEWLKVAVDVHAADNRNPGPKPQNLLDPGPKKGGIRQINFRDPSELVEVRENKWENAMKGLQDQVRAKVELQRETLERTLREKIALKRRLFDEEDFIIRQKVAERDHQIKVLRDKIDTEQLMNNAEKDDILREIQRLEKLQDEAEDDLLRFQIHIEEEIQEMGIKERAQLQFSMMKTLAGDLGREVTRRMRSKDYWHSPDETPAEAEDPAEQALIEISSLKKQNHEILTVLQHLTGELKKLREENEVLKSQMDYGGGAGGYMTAGGPTAGGPDDLDPDLDMDINKIIDVQQTRSQALDLVNSLIEADGDPAGSARGSYGRHQY